MEELPEELVPVLECSSSAFVKVAGPAKTEQVRRKVTAVLAVFVHREHVKLERKRRVGVFKDEYKSSFKSYLLQMLCKVNTGVH